MYLSRRKESSSHGRRCFPLRMEVVWSGGAASNSPYVATVALTVQCYGSATAVQQKNRSLSMSHANSGKSDA